MIVRFEQGNEKPVLEADKRDAERPFKSGSRGWFASGKITLDGKRYQVSCSVVEIGSKPAQASSLLDTADATA